MELLAQEGGPLVAAAPRFEVIRQRALASLISEVTRDSAGDPLTEKVGLRRASDLTDFALCRKCPGRDCGRCWGYGFTGSREAGQRVWVSRSGVAVFIDFDFGAFLEALSVTIAGTTPLDPLVGRDGDGEVVAVVMPMKMPAAAKTKRRPVTA